MLRRSLPRARAPTFNHLNTIQKYFGLLGGRCPSFRFELTIRFLGRYRWIVPKRPRRPRDPNLLAFQVVRLASGEVHEPVEREKNPHAVALGRIGGAVGGK